MDGATANCRDVRPHEVVVRERASLVLVQALSRSPLSSRLSAAASGFLITRGSQLVREIERMAYEGDHGRQAQIQHYVSSHAVKMTEASCSRRTCDQQNPGSRCSYPLVANIGIIVGVR